MFQPLVLKMVDAPQLPPAGGGRFHRDPLGLSPANARSNSQSPFRLPMPTISPAQLAFSALQYLPVPTLVLNNLKTVVLANGAMGRMLGMAPEQDEENDPLATIERLRGQTLAQVGIDMLQDGRPVWVSWEVFLDTLTEEMGVRAPVADSRSLSDSKGDATPTIGSGASPALPHNPPEKRTQDTVVEVVISRKDFHKSLFDGRYKSKDADLQIFAKMIITIWEIEDRQTFFTLTFTNSLSSPSTLANPRKSIARPSVLEAAERRTIHNSNPPSVASSRESSSPSFHSPGVVSMSSSPFPPMGPPSSATTQSSTPSLLRKIILMKDALLDNTEMPILAMWKDGSVLAPNKAARNLLVQNADFDTSTQNLDNLANWEVWTEDFSRKLTVDEYPITDLIRSETPFSGLRVGMYTSEGKKCVYDCLGETILDESTGQFLAAVVTGRDVTEMTEEIVQIKERDEERFKLICDTMPQLVWTATAEGLHDFFNAGWYEYTGLSPDESLGMGWQSPFHPDDMPEALARWQHSLKTGDPYVTEYRCRRKDGQWRWFLGRALALKNKETGKVEKWFGKDSLRFAQTQFKNN